ncbi:hypothetical protein ACOBQB_10735 [Streptomyces sp. G5(2025)]|uniref:hypothetical protein n=1 Tax=Streptomyces sp. G5(2025) TaxID=3406628 RepID=UPI003C280AE6
MSEMEPAIARVLGVYYLVISPRGSTAVFGQLMMALRPPTKPERDEETGNWVSAYNRDRWGRADGPGAAGGHR